MTEPQLSIRSAKAWDIAHRLARRENRSLVDIVERALEAYAARESAAAFYDRMAAAGRDEDIDLEVIINENRRKHTGIDL